MKDLIHLSPELVCCIAEVKPGAPADYVTRTLEAVAVGESRPATGTRVGVRLPLAELSEHPRMSAAHRAVVERLTRCAVGSIDRAYSLQPGEHVERDEARFLARGHDGVPAATPLIRRHTNMAVLDYLILNVQVQSNGDLTRTDLTPRAPAAPPVAPAVPKMLLVRGAGEILGSVACWAGGQIAGGLASSIGGAIFQSLQAELFPPGPPSYFDEVYKQMTKIVGQEISTAQIRAIDAALHNVQAHLRDEYGPARGKANLQHEADRVLLFGLLQKYDAAFLSGPDGMLGLLRTPECELAGFAAFVLGASLQLALFQEMANVVPQRDDRHRGWLPPLQTSYGMPKTGTVALTAAELAAHVEKTWPKIRLQRAARISVKEWEKLGYVMLGGIARTERRGAIVDGGDQVEERAMSKPGIKDRSDPTRDQLVADGERYKEARLADLERQHQRPLDIAAQWRRLVAQPIRTAA